MGIYWLSEKPTGRLDSGPFVLSNLAGPWRGVPRPGYPVAAGFTARARVQVPVDPDVPVAVDLYRVLADGELEFPVGPLVGVESLQSLRTDEVVEADVQFGRVPSASAIAYTSRTINDLASRPSVPAMLVAEQMAAS